MRNITVNPGICGCAGELSTINATYDSESIQPFVCALYIHGKDFTFLKHVGFLAFTMTSSGSFFTRSTRCSHSGESNFTLFTTSVFFYSRGSTWKKRPILSALKISCNLYLGSIVGRCDFFQCPNISGVHNFTSPETVLTVTLFRAFHVSTRRFSAL